MHLIRNLVRLLPLEVRAKWCDTKGHEHIMTYAELDMDGPTPSGSYHLHRATQYQAWSLWLGRKI